MRSTSRRTESADSEGSVFGSAASSLAEALKYNA